MGWQIWKQEAQRVPAGSSFNHQRVLRGTLSAQGSKRLDLERRCRTDGIWEPSQRTLAELGLGGGVLGRCRGQQWS